MVALLDALNLLGCEDADERIQLCLDLQVAARAVGETWTHGIAAMSDLQVSMVVDRRDRKNSAEADERLDTKAKAVRVFAKFAERKGKAYHRAQQAGNKHARKTAENAARERLSAKVVKILVDAQLPFGAEVQEKGWDSE